MRVFICKFVPMLHNKHIADLRTDYDLHVLNEGDLGENPIENAKRWLQQAIDAKVDEPTAMHLATVNSKGMPHVRVVLLKDILEDGFVFFTNYDSKKAQDMEQNPSVCINFFWTAMHRQIRVQGKVEKTSDAYNDEYFYSRPLESQKGAMASPQSAVIANRTVLEENMAAIGEIVRPPNWGGYLIKPNYIEFWQGRPNRLHDRLVWEWIDTAWKQYRLAP